jgi:hypothetical protein
VTDIPRVFIPSQLSQTKLQFPFSFKESSWLGHFLRYRSVCQYSWFQNSGAVYVHTECRYSLSQDAGLNFSQFTVSSSTRHSCFKDCFYRSVLFNLYCSRNSGCNLSSTLKFVPPKLLVYNSSYTYS